jgi:hypothetical protein
MGFILGLVIKDGSMLKLNEYGIYGNEPAVKTDPGSETRADSSCQENGQAVPQDPSTACQDVAGDAAARSG